MKYLTIIIVILICGISISFAQHNITLNKINEVLVAGKHITFLKDSSGVLTIQDILKTKNQKRFKENNSNVFVKPASKASYWFKLSMSNASSEDAWLSLGNVDGLSIDFYPPDSTGRYQTAFRTGSLHPFKSRLYKTINDFWFPLNKRQDKKSITYYIRIQQVVSFQLPFKVGTLRALNHEKDIKDGFNMAFLGIMLIMILYNSFLFFATKDNIYLVYVGYLLTSALSFTFINSYPIIAVITDYQFQYFLYHYFVTWNFLPMFFVGFFCIRYLDLKQHGPRFRKAIYGILLTNLLLVILDIADGLSEMVLLDLFQLITLLLTLTCFIASLYALWFKKVVQARYYALGWFFYVLAVIVFILVVNEVLPGNIYLQNALYFGISIEVWLFSLALGDKFRAIRREKDEVQNENLRLIEEQKELLEEKVEERTKEIWEQKEELKQNIEELKTTQEFLEWKQYEVLQKNERIEFLYKNLTDSVNYAQRIQQAVLPTKATFDQVFPENFILFRPRDLVSGDFYYLQEVDGKTILAAVDCTGHGVPGAFMSLIGNNLLTEIVVNQKITQPHLILEKLHVGVRQLLHQQQTKNQDGMDMALVVIDRQNKVLEFSGAYNPLLYVQGGALQIIKGDKLPIGGEQRETIRVFTQHQIKLDQPTTIYLFSDGYQDQFGGAKGRKFMRRRFYELFQQYLDQPLASQYIAFTQMLDEWQGSETQTDDILLMGVKL